MEMTFIVEVEVRSYKILVFLLQRLCTRLQTGQLHCGRQTQHTLSPSPSQTIFRHTGKNWSRPILFSFQAVAKIVM